VPSDPQLSSVDPEPGPLAPALIAVVTLGGAIGTALRYGVGQWMPATTGFPWSTFAVNLVGAFMLGALLEVLTRAGPDDGRRRQLRLLLGTGFCGGLTTYSTFAVEADLLGRSHRDGLAVTYALVSIVAGIAVTALGIALAARADRRHS
jgi:fluoride exporter